MKHVIPFNNYLLKRLQGLADITTVADAGFPLMEVSPSKGNEQEVAAVISDFAMWLEVASPSNHGQDVQPLPIDHGYRRTGYPTEPQGE
jgi:hypothetical protein